ncbi:MAG: hypothetical protein KBG20_02655 [Caldilineaceae bacterium]|nr:hypothetical protein [Caldilineaceae bacterium]MBP8106280.1 hypothetical protein [Caldilineaceae bacterium]MBP8122602.1 hypothetical protein [Caldilineaceae bacterium]MBP9071164.1 hypothetical protein [Caldilineaceae bacterium]
MTHNPFQRPPYYDWGLDRWKIGAALLLFVLLWVWLLKAPPTSQLPPPPTLVPLTLTEPGPGSVDVNAAQLFRGTAPVNSPVAVMDAQLGELGRTMPLADGSWTLETGSAWTAGAYRLQAVTLDPLTGQPLAGGSMVVPVVALSSPQPPLLLQGADLSQDGSILLLSGQAPSGVTLSVLEIDEDRRTPLGQAQADRDGRWQVHSGLPATNPFQIVMVAQDPTGAVLDESNPTEVVLPIALTATEMPPQPTSAPPTPVPTPALATVAPAVSLPPVAAPVITPTVTGPIQPVIAPLIDPSTQPVLNLPIILQPGMNSQIAQVDLLFAGTALAASRLRLAFTAGPDSLPNLPSAQAWVTNDGHWSVGLGETLPPGRYQVVAVALDPAGAESGRSAPVEFEVVETAQVAQVVGPTPTRPTVAPTAVVHAPVTVGTRFPRFSGQAEANRLLWVQTVDGAGNTQQGYVRAGADGRWTFVPTFPLASGVTTATVQIVGGGVSARHDLAVLIPEQVGMSGALATGLQVSAPAPGLLSNRLPPIYGLAVPGTQVIVRIDDQVAATAQADAQGNWYALPPAPLAVGDHWLVVHASSGDEVGPLVLTVTAQTPTVPAPALDPTPERMETARFTITGVAQPGQAVGIRVNGVAVVTVSVDAAGRWRWQPDAAQAEGPLYLQARILGADGSVVSESAVRVVVYYVPLGG